MTGSVVELDWRNPVIVAQLRAFLAPQEKHALFLLGNLQREIPDTHLYAVQQGGRWRALAGYYGGPSSCIPFLPTGEDPAGVAAVIAHIQARHRPFDWLLGPASMATPALAVLIQRGYRVVNDPVQVFMECSQAPPKQPHQLAARLMLPSDVDAVARLMRWLRAGTDDGREVTAKERQDLAIEAARVVLAIDGQVVSSACTNGLGISAYQVLGVATHPAHRGRGYAGATVAALMQHMSAQGGRHAILFTRHDNHPAIRCYERLGYRITGDYTLAKLAPPA